MLIIQLVLLFLLFVLFVMTISALVGVPFLPTHRKQAIKMMELAGIKPGVHVVDLGSGAGRLLFLAEASGATKAVGYELNPFLVWWTRLAAKLKGASAVTVQRQSLYQADLRNVDVVFTFLFPGPMKKIAAKLFSELKPGAKIVSYTFPIPGKTPVMKEQGIFVYEV